VRALILWLVAFTLAQVVWMSFMVHLARQATIIATNADYQRCLSVHAPLEKPKGRRVNGRAPVADLA
jgi:hypothetical protein